MYRCSDCGVALDPCEYCNCGGSAQRNAAARNRSPRGGKEYKVVANPSVIIAEILQHIKRITAQKG